MENFEIEILISGGAKNEARVTGGSKLPAVHLLIKTKRTKRMKKKIHYRQGDLLIERIPDQIRDTKKQKRLRRIVLAEGEATGHHHVLEVGEYSDPADWWKDGEAQMVNLSSPAVIRHEEHGRIPLPAGTYRITRQREYSPEEIRNVAD